VDVFTVAGMGLILLGNALNLRKAQG
jgi:hypothetical protein